MHGLPKLPEYQTGLKMLVRVKHSNLERHAKESFKPFFDLIKHGLDLHNNVPCIGFGKLVMSQNQYRNFLHC